MKTERVFWGIILVFVGVIFLLENFGVISFSWQYIWRFWPVILIICGINILFARNNNRTGTFVMAAVTVLVLGFLTYKGLEKNRFKEHDYFFDNNYDNEVSETSNYIEDYNEKYKYAKLEIAGGASNFEIDSVTEKLFNANLTGVRNNYFLKKTDYDSVVNLDFRNKGQKGFKFDEEGFGKVKIMLSNKPVWDIDLKMGAGSVDFDLQNYKIRKLDLKGGAAEFNLKIGDLADTINVNAQTGLAAVSIKIPENSGCNIKTSSGLSSKDFEGFKDLGNGVFETPNFNESKKKIFIVLKGGLSDLKVKKYD